MFIIPIIYYLVDKYELNGLIVCFLINILFEILCKVVSLQDGYYRLLSFRYIFIVSFGCYLFKSNCIKNVTFWIAGLLGVAYIIIFKYLETNHLFINEAWAGTSVLAVLYILPIVRIFIKNKRIHNNLLELLGKASYNIFLVQMVYFIASSRMYNYVSFVPLRIVINIIICCSIGVLFYKIENPITSKIIKKISGK